MFLPRQQAQWMPITALSILLIYIWLNRVDIDEVLTRERREVENGIVNALIESSPHILTDFSTEDGSQFTIIQRWRKNGDELLAVRAIVIHNQWSFTLSAVHLQIPPVVLPLHVDPLQWKVDHSKLYSGYLSTMAAAAFMVQALPFNDSPRRMLQIGMGGGALTGFFAQLPLNLNITVVELDKNVYTNAEKYFDIMESPRLHVFLDDGVAFASKMASSGTTYDVIMLDACLNNISEAILCPVPVFFSPTTLSDLSRITSPAGMICVNLLALAKREFHYNRILRLFAAHFTSCFRLYYGVKYQMVLVCSKKNWNPKNPQDEMWKNVREFDRRLGFNMSSSIRVLDP